MLKVDLISIFSPLKSTVKTSSLIVVTQAILWEFFIVIGENLAVLGCDFSGICQEVTPSFKRTFSYFVGEILFLISTPAMCMGASTLQNYGRLALFFTGFAQLHISLGLVKVQHLLLDAAV